jgi:hypothetical protein
VYGTPQGSTGAAPSPYQRARAVALNNVYPLPQVQLTDSTGRNNIVSPPAGFNWPFALYPLVVRRVNGVVTTDFNPEAYVRAELAGPSFFVNGSTGNNANPGTLAQPVKSIWKGTQLANATGVPCNVLVAWISGGYSRADGFSNASTTVPNTVPIAYIATGAPYPAKGGIIDVWVGDNNLTWSGTTDATYTTLYTATRSNVSQIINPTVLDAYGDPVMGTQYADAASAHAASGNAWAQVGTLVYAKWAGGAPVTNANTHALLKATPNFVQDGTSKSVYLKGFNFHGGANGAVAFTAAANMNFIAVNCSAGYAGDAATNVNAFKLDFMTGLCALVNCIGTNAEADDINGHWTPGGTPGLYPLTIGCIGRNAGRDTVLSCNALTFHDNIIAIDIGGEYYRSYGANVIPINGCQLWCVGTNSHDAFGDISHGGVATPIDYQTQGTAKMWLAHCQSSGSAIALMASDTSTILTHGFVQSEGQKQTRDAGALFLTY